LTFKLHQLFWSCSDIPKRKDLRLKRINVLRPYFWDEANGLFIHIDVNSSCIISLDLFLLLFFFFSILLVIHIIGEISSDRLGISIP
jgi:hypothetical protein